MCKFPIGCCILVFVTFFRCNNCHKYEGVIPVGDDGDDGGDGGRGPGAAGGGDHHRHCEGGEEEE